VTTKDKMTIFTIEEENKENSKRMTWVTSINFLLNLNGLFDIWNNEDNKNLIALEKSHGVIEIFTLIHNSLSISGPNKTIETGFKALQKIIFSHRFLFIVDEQGVYIKCYDNNNFNLLCELYRGKKTSTINNIIELDKTSIDDKFSKPRLAVSSSNGTIHIYELKNTEIQSDNLFSSLTKGYTYILGNQLKSLAKIHLNLLINDEIENRNIICNRSNTNNQNEIVKYNFIFFRFALVIQEI
jgi:hypothetical protein